MRLSARWALAVTLSVLVAGCGKDPVTPTPTATVTNISYSSTMLPGGSAWRSFNLERSGKVSIQLVAMAPQTDAVMRLSLGSFDGTNCTPTTTLDTASATTAQISTDVAAGNYCARLADLGAVTQISVFAILIVVTVNP